MRAFMMVVGVALAAPTIAQAQIIEDSQLWTTVTVAGTVKGNIVFAGDAQFRVVDDISRYAQTTIRGAIGVKLNPKITVLAGYAHIVSERVDRPDGIENRTYQQLNWNLGQALGGAVTTRARLEQRWMRGGRDVGWRYRQQLRFLLPLKQKGPSLIMAGEALFNLNSTDWGAKAGLDQLRGLVGVSLPLSKVASIETGYQPIYVNAAPRDRLNHVIPVTLVLKF